MHNNLVYDKTRFIGDLQCTLLLVLCVLTSSGPGPLEWPAACQYRCLNSFARSIPTALQDSRQLPWDLGAYSILISPNAVISHSSLFPVYGPNIVKSEMFKLVLRGGGKKSTSRRKTCSIHNWKAKHKRPGENPLQVQKLQLIVQRC